MVIGRERSLFCQEVENGLLLRSNKLLDLHSCMHFTVIFSSACSAVADSDDLFSPPHCRNRLICRPGEAARTTMRKWCLPASESNHRAIFVFSFLFFWCAVLEHLFLIESMARSSSSCVLREKEGAPEKCLPPRFCLF